MADLRICLDGMHPLASPAEPARKENEMNLDPIFSTIASAAFMQSGRDYQAEWMRQPQVSWQFERNNNEDLDLITVHLTWCDTRPEWIGKEKYSVSWPRKDWKNATAEMLIKGAIIAASKGCDFTKRK